jgi:hypothetical protein
LPHLIDLSGDLILGEYRRVAFFGGIYSNYLALDAALRMARSMRAEAVFALGDLGAFGPHPDRTVDLIREEGIPCIQGNYEESLATGAGDCRCGYTDPRDNHYAGISYAYTAANTSPNHKVWMASLPRHLRMTLGGRRVLGCHGSPRQVNEFLWRSTTSDAFLRRMLDDCGADILFCTHTGLHWQRFLPDGRGMVNVGALGRPANDGRTEVWFALADAAGSRVKVQFLPVVYDHRRLAREMEEEGLPAEFRETLLTGWWTTCLEILPAKERAQGRY